LFAYPVKGEDEIKEYINALKNEYPDATHHCFAWRLGPQGERYRYYDDGEPSGTASRPIYGQILSHELTNILVVVVRYFGGTKLGVSGLIEAYKTSAHMVLSSCKVIEKKLTVPIKLFFSYELMNTVMSLTRELDAEVLNIEYLEHCIATIEVELSKKEMALKRLSDIYGIRLIEN
jgi:uncharacterized YigZ family protein